VVTRAMAIVDGRAAAQVRANVDSLVRGRGFRHSKPRL
jgi:hypothetical protein